MHRTLFVTLCLVAVTVRAGTYTNDLFARALANDSTAPDYVLITVVDPKTREERSVCTTSNLFLGAIHREHGLGYADPDIKRAKAIALKQRDRRFVFTRKAALDNLADYATPEALAEVHKVFATKTDSQLFDEKLIQSLTDTPRNMPHKEAWARHQAYRDAVARVLLERGIGCTMGDIGDFLSPHK
jgi:hypothetical protein